MKIRFNATGAQRRALVKAIAEITGADFRYLGVPSLCYEVDYLAIDREGTLIFDDSADAKEIERLLDGLAERGFIAEEEGKADAGQEAAAGGEAGAQGQEAAGPEKEAAAPATERDSANEAAPTMDDAIGLTVSLPIAGFGEDAMRNLKALVASKARLIKKALGIDDLPIEAGEERISFPWFSVTPDAPDATAYADFIAKLCRAARTQKRVTAKEREVENEKYAFRCFLLRLGFIGAEHKAARKILLRNLAGNGSFRDGKRKEAAGHEISGQGGN